jgi:hypothetical protein
MFRKNTAGQFIHFQGVDSATGGIKSGVSWTVRRCIDGTFAAATGTVTEDGTTGWYKLAMSQADTNGNNIGFNFTGTGAVPQTVNIVTTDLNPYDAVRAGLTALPNANAGASGGLWILGANSAATTTLSGVAAAGATPGTPALQLTGGAASTTGGGVAAEALKVLGGAGAASTNGAAIGLTATGGPTNTVASNAHGVSFVGASTGAGLNAQSGAGATGNGITAKANSTNGHGVQSDGAGTGDGMQLTKGASGADLDADIQGALDTVTTVTNQLTTAQIATGVWQDAPAGDFTVASSIGKALYISNIAPGAAGGHFISGSNSGTTTVGALTVTGAFTVGTNAIPWNAAYDAEVESEVDDALVARFLDKLILASGTADSGSTTTMVDAARTEGDADYWKGRLILFTSGTIAGQCAIIEDFNGGTDTFTFKPALTQVVGTQTYVILPGISVWDETLAEHLAAGTTGNALNAAGAAGDPWSTALPGAYGAGTAGKIVGDNLNATVSSRSSHSAADVWASGTRTLTSLAGLTVDTVTTLTNLPAITANWLTAAGMDPTAGAEIADAVWDEAVAGHLTAGSTGLYLYNVHNAVIGKTGGSVNDAGATSTAFNTTLTDANDFWNDSLLVFTSGNLNGQCRPILDFANVNGRITLDEALTAAPDNGSTFLIKSEHVHPTTQIASAVRTELTTELGRIDVATSTRASQASLDTLDDYVDTEVAAIKAKTDSLTFTVAGVLDANIQYVNDTQVAGAGTAGNPWGP